MTSRLCRLPLIALLALLLAGPLQAETPDRPLVLRAERLLMVETGEIVDDPVVVIEKGAIVSLDGSGIPQDAVEIDLGDRTLLPGLIDTHVHLAITDATFGRNLLSIGTADATLQGVEAARRTLYGGFTTVRDLAQVYPVLDLITVALARATADGRIEGPEILPVGHALSITGGHIDPAMFFSGAEGVLDHLGPEYGVADGADEVLKATRYQIKHGARAIKLAATAGVMSFEETVGAQQYSEEEMRLAVEEAARHGIRVAAHAHGTDGINAAIRAGVASIEHGSILDDESIRLLKEHGTYLVPTTALRDVTSFGDLPPEIVAKKHLIMPLALQSIERAIREGVKIAVGSDAPLIPHGENAREILALARRGMSPAQAIGAATVAAADLLDLPDRGRLAPGLRADIIAVPGNPLEDLDVLLEVELVVKAGAVVVDPRR